MTVHIEPTLKPKPIAPDLTSNTAGIISPNPFWLASAPPANSGDQVKRAFDAGWGGAVWKTLGNPIVNVSSRFGAIEYGGKRVMGFNNIELITDRPLETNFREIADVKKHYPKHAVIVSLMVETREEWKEIIARSEDAGADGVSLINTIKSIVGVDIDTFVPRPVVGNLSTNGGYCGVAVKPIALHMVAALAREKEFGLPISGIGGIANWRDAVEFLLLGSSSVQVCTEVMLKGYRIVEDMIEGLNTWMDEKGFERLDQVIGKSIPHYSEWGDLDLNYETVAKIDAAKCIGCQLCMVACHDGAHQCIHPNPDGTRIPVVDEAECVGCNLCQIVCPVQGCISMVPVQNGFAPATWNQHVEQGLALRPKKGAH